MPFNIGPFELLLVLIVVLLIVGPGKLPEVGSALGRTIREFRRTSTEVEDTMRLEPSAGGSAAEKPVSQTRAATGEQAEASEDRASL